MLCPRRQRAEGNVGSRLVARQVALFDEIVAELAEAEADAAASDAEEAEAAAESAAAGAASCLAQAASASAATRALRTRFVFIELYPEKEKGKR